MIAGTQAQTDILMLKSKHSFGEDKRVGVGYWNGFRKRNGHLVFLKRGAKYELDRSKWTAYTNLAHMYNHIYDEMIDACIAAKLETPIWQNCYGNICTEEDVFGCKVTHELTHLEICIVMDEIG